MNNLAPYEVVKDLFRTGDVIEYHGFDAPGPEIRFRTGYDVNHSELVVVMKSPYTGVMRRYTHAALSPGFMPTYLSNTLANYNGIAYWYPIRDEFVKDIPDIEARAFEYLGVGYDYTGLVKNLFGRTPIEKGLMFCSEACQVCWDLVQEGVAWWPGELIEKGQRWQQPRYQLIG